MSEKMVTVGQMLRGRMDKLGLDEYDLARNAGLYESTIRAILSDKTRLDEYSAKRIEKATGMSKDFLLALDSYCYRKKAKQKFLQKSQKCGQAVFSFY